MLRAIVVVGFILGLISVIVFGPTWMQTTENKATDTDLPACDLLSGPCDWEAESGQWQVELKTVGDKGQGTEYELRVFAPAAPDRFLAVLRGESMYMGEYPVPLRSEKDGSYSAHFTAPFCTIDSEMVWRIDLQAGQNALSEPTPLKLTFQAQHNPRP